MNKNLLILFVILLFHSGLAFGQEAHSLFFDKQGCVDIPEITELTGTAARTVEAWIKFPSDAEVLDWWQPVIIEWGQNNAGEKWCFRLDHYRLRVEHAGGYIFATSTLNDDQWHHVAVTVAADANIADVKFYIDGVEDAVEETGGGTPAINTASGPISIGRSVADDQTDRIFTGHIDEVRLWKKQLSAQEISDVYGTEICPDEHPDLLAYYKFNEGTGETAYDETGNYDGTLATGTKSDALPAWDDGATVTIVDCNGPAGDAYSLFFDKQGCVDIPEITELTGTAARTVEAWIKFPSDAEVLDWWQPVIIEWGQNNAGEKWCFRLDHYRLRVEHAGGYIFATSTLNDDQWHHVAVTVAADANIADVKFYIDGVEDSMEETGGGTPAINTASGPISIGRSVADDQTDRIFTGHIDEVRLWKKQLSAQEISDIFGTEICPDEHPDLLAYYKFNEGTGETAYDETGNYDGTLATGTKSDALPAWDGGASVTSVECGGGTAVAFDELSDMFEVYPNPAYKQIRINTDRSIENLIIYNLTGLQVKIMENYSNDDIDISSFAPGIYLMRAVFDTGETSTMKFIKK